MARLKSLKSKNKDFVFTSYENDKEEKPAKIIFSRFPIPGENFTMIDKKNILEGIDLNNAKKRELESAIVNNIIENFMNNLRSGAIDYKRFFDECVESVENLEFEKSKIITVNDFWQILPQDAAYAIAKEAFDYANTREEFTMGNLKA